jgi:hypothetical protein
MYSPGLKVIHASQLATIATTVAAMAEVASQPITCSRRGGVNPAMMVRRIVSRIIMTMTGTATTPLTTEFQMPATLLASRSNDQRGQ